MFPIIFESGPISIQTLWVFVVIALLISSYLAVKRLKRRRVNLTLFIEHSSSYLISALVVSRFVYFFLNPSTYFPEFDFRTIWNFISIWDQGFSFWGAIIGFTGMLTYQLHKAKEEIWRWYDALSVPLIIGMIIGYVGAFLGGYAYGIPTNLPWGIRYEVINVIYTVPIHPTQIYAIILLSFILWSKNKLKTKTEFFKTNGNTSFYFLTTLSLAFFLLEFVRGDDTLILLGIRLPHFLFLATFLVSSVLLFRRVKDFKSGKHESTETTKS